MNTDIISTHDNLNLHAKVWKTDGAKADILFLHGFFEHSGRYAKEAEALNANGYNFYAYDQRSHGQSDGKYRSFIKDFENYLEDYKLAIRQFELGTIRPFFLMSHSMGGLVQCSYLLDTNKVSELFRGAIFSAPLIMPDSNTAPLLQKMSGVVGTLFPTLKTIQIDPQHISRDPKEIELYVRDALNYTDKMYASSGYQLLKQMKKIRPFFSQFNHPMIVLHGTEDRLAEFEGGKLLYEEARSEDKEFAPLENYKHEILKELDNDIVWSRITSWMDKRL